MTESAKIAYPVRLDDLIDVIKRVHTEPLEQLTLGGTLGPDGVHLHASVSDAQGRVYLGTNRGVACS